MRKSRRWTAVASCFVASMDRLVRSLSDPYCIVDDLISRGASVWFLKEGQAYSTDSTPVANLMFRVLRLGAEFDRSIIRECYRLGEKRGVCKGE